MNSKINTREIAIIYRVYYRLMKTTLAPKAKLVSSKGATMLMEANQEHSNIFVPRMLKWNEILVKDEWHFDVITQPKVEPESSDIEQIIQHLDGSIDLKFLKGRYSFSASSSKPREDNEEYSDNSGETIPERKVQGIDYSQPIPKVHYQPV